MTTRQPMEYVNVMLHNAFDSSVIKDANSNQAGEYILKNIDPGTYFLEINLIGFDTVVTPVFNVNETGQQIAMDTITISVSAFLLSEVEIVEKKALYENAIDRKIYNVDMDLMSTSGSAIDVLENVPSVSVDIEGRISLRGSGNVTIFINGRPSPLMKVNSAAALQAIPANTIERIEIITNPSAKFKPDGVAGIINIVLVKNTRPGLNGTITVNAGIDERYNGSIILNYKPGRINLFASIGIRQEDRNHTTSDFRRLYDSTGIMISDYDQFSTSFYRPFSQVFNAGADYSINEKNTVGISASYFHVGFEREENAATILHDSTENLTSDFSRDLLGNDFETEMEVNLNYEHQFKKEDHSLSFDLTIADQHEEEDNHFTETYRVPVLPDANDNTLIRQSEKLTELAVEYVYPVNEEAEIEAGYLGEFIYQDLNFYGEYFDPLLDAWVKDNLKSNQFLFDQKVHAIYATFSQGIEDFRFSAGLRSEQAYITSNPVTWDSIIKNNYFKVYPTLHLTYEITDNKQLQLSYSKRITRPEADELNPFPEYADPLDLEAGNPNLKPEQVHSVEFGYSLKNERFTFLPTLYYRFKYDAFSEISTYINDTVLLSTFENLKSEQSAGLELVVTTRLKKLISLNLSSNIFYNQIDASNLDFSENKSAFSSITKLGINLNVTKTTLMQFNGNYRSSQLTPQGKILPFFVLNAGIRQNILKDRAAFLLTVSDVFNTYRWTTEINTTELYEIVVSKRKSQIIFIGFTFNFGKSHKKIVEDLQFDEKM